MFSRPGVRGLALSVGAFVALLALYQGLIWAGALPASGGMTQWEENIIRAERYTFGDSRGAVVVVGSSLATNMMASADWPEAVNLGMNGGATQTGLEVLRRSPGAPGVVLVELNDTIGRGLDGDLLDGIFTPGVYQARSALSMLRTEYRPMSVLVRLLATMDGGAAAAPPAPSPLDAPAQLRPFEQQQRERAVERAYPGLMEPLPAEEAEAIRREAALIKAQIAELEAAGWRVLLTDLPRDSRLAETTQEREVRALLDELFPADRYTWLPAPPAREWTTRDGSHLVRSDARLVADFLRAEVAEAIASR